MNEELNELNNRLVALLLSVPWHRVKIKNRDMWFITNTFNVITANTVFKLKVGGATPRTFDVESNGKEMRLPYDTRLMWRLEQIEREEAEAGKAAAEVSAIHTLERWLA